MADEALSRALDVPTLLVDRFYVMAGPGGVRLMFGERPADGQDRYHSSVTMNLENAEELANLILGQVKIVRDGKAAAPKPAGGVH